MIMENVQDQKENVSSNVSEQKASFISPTQTMESNIHVDDNVRNKIMEMSRIDPNLVKRNEYKGQQVTLPSKGLVYPPDHPLRKSNGIILLRQMTAADEDILYDRQLLKKDMVFNTLITRCIVQPAGIDGSDLVLGDQNTVLVALRIGGLGADYNVELTCDECENKFHEQYMLNGIVLKIVNEFEDGTKVATETKNGTFLITLPDCNEQCEIRLLSVREEAEITQAVEKAKKGGISLSQTVNRLMKIIVSIGGNSDKAHIREMVEKVLSLKDSKYIREMYNDIQPDIIMKKSYECPQCYTEKEFDIPIDAGFFWPELTRKRGIR